jgi:ABC-2 type transport system permease protein
LVVVLRLAAHRRPLDDARELQELQELQGMFIFNFIPHALVPLIALLYAAGMIRDEIEEQTLTYLLLRPLWRPALYLTKLAATWLVTAAMAAVFTTLTFAVVWWGKPQLWDEVIPVRAAKTAAVLALALLGYCSLFGALGLYTRRSLLVGLAYIVAFEGLLANVPMMVRQLTVMYYFRVLVARWIAPTVTGKWELDLKEAWSARNCVLALVVASAVFALAGAVMMARGEFRMKTPEGS